MNAHFETLLNEFETAAKKVKAVLDVATAKSPVTSQLEKWVPGLAGLVGHLGAIDGFAGAAATAVPQVEIAIGAIETLRALGAKPNTDLDHVGPGKGYDIYD